MADMPEHKHAEAFAGTPEFLRAVIDGTTDAVFVKDIQGRYVMINAAGAEFVGKPIEEILGKNDMELWPSEAARRLMEDDRRVLVSGEALTFEETVTVAGDSRTFLTAKSVCRDREGKVLGLIGIARDITERKRAEERFRLVVESAPNAMVMIGQEGKIIFINAQAEKLFGYSREELIDQAVEILVPGRFRSKHPQYRTDFFADLRARPMGAGRDLYGLRKDGTEIPVEIGLNPIKTEAGVLVLAAIVDITERKRAEETAKALSRVGRELASTLDLAQATEQVVSAVRRLFRARRAVLYQLDETRDVLVCAAIDGVRDPGRWIGRTLPISAALAGQAVAEGRPVVIPDLLADPRTAEWVRELIREEGGEAGVAVPLVAHGKALGTLVLGDVAGRVFTEAEIELLSAFADQAALALRNARLYEQARKRAQELARSNAELEQFAYVASHDLQEPLRMVTMHTQLLAKRYAGHLAADAEEFIKHAVAGAKRLQELINALLEYSRAGSGGEAFAPIDCEVVLERALGNLRAELRRSGGVVGHDPLPTVLADEAQLGQVLQNLLSNAIKFSGGRLPRIHLSARLEGREMVFAVRDNGIGIAPEDTERIFEVFQRLHGREYPGSGMGLAICKRIVERHGGRIWVESTPGRGSTFFFTIPAGGDALE